MTYLAATEGLAYHLLANKKKPTIVIVPSTFHTPAHFGPLSWYLETQGYSSSFALRMPSSSGAGMAEDVSTIQRVLEELVLKNEEDVVLVMHAYGAVPGCQAVAAAGLQRAVRVKEGKDGGVTSLVLIGGWLVREEESKESTMKALGETGILGYVELGIPSILQPPSTPPSNLFSDLPPEKAAYWTSQLKPQHPIGVYTAPVQNLCWSTTTTTTTNISTTYITCTKDPYEHVTNALLAEMKERENWSIKSIEAGHAPFLSRVEEVGNLILESARIGKARGMAVGGEGLRL